MVHVPASAAAAVGGASTGDDDATTLTDASAAAGDADYVAWIAIGQEAEVRQAAVQDAHAPDDQDARDPDDAGYDDCWPREPHVPVTLPCARWPMPADRHRPYLTTAHRPNKHCHWAVAAPAKAVRLGGRQALAPSADIHALTVDRDCLRSIAAAAVDCVARVPVAVDVVAAAVVVTVVAVVVSLGFAVYSALAVA